MDSKQKKNRPVKNFGYLVSFVFLILTLYPLIKGNNLNVWFLGLTILFLIITIFFHKILELPSRVWYKLGNFLHKVISPIIMLLVYIFSIVLVAMIMKALRRDPIDKKIYDKAKKSYWIKRKELVKDNFNLNDQF